MRRNVRDRLGKVRPSRLDVIHDEFMEPKWDDIVFEFTRTRVNPTTSKPDYDEVNLGLLFPQNITTEAIFITVQMPHRWEEGTTIFPHVHVIQAHAGQAVFKLDYKWYNIGDPVPAEWETYVMDTYAYTPEYTTPRSQIVKGAGISGEGKGISSILKLKLYRDDNAYVGDILADQFDIHILIDELGSRLQYTK